MNFLLNRSTIVDHSVKPPFSPTSVAPLEVGGAFDSLVSLEELVPDGDWQEVLSATWGLPYEELRPPRSPSWLQALRSVFPFGGFGKR